MDKHEIPTPQFSSYEEEAAFWDNFDTSDYMPDEGWLEIETDTKRSVHPALSVDTNLLNSE